MLDHHPLLQNVIKILRAHQVEAYLVGGAVRDLLLGRQTIVDLDFAVPGRSLTVARKVANALQAAFYPLDPERGTGRVVHNVPVASGLKKFYLDFADFRGATLAEDLRDRDFTINAIALSLTDPPQLIDPLAGQRDLEIGQIRATSATAFQHDPVRVLRAVRQSTELGFSIETQTEQDLRQAVTGLVTVSPERQRDELLKLLNTPTPGQAVQKLRHLGILPHLLPEIEVMIGVSQPPPHYLDVFDHTTTALDAWTSMLQAELPDIPARLQEAVRQYLNEGLAGSLTPQLLMPLALLWHDAGKPLTRTEQAGPPVKIRFLGHERESARIACRAMKHFHFSNQAIRFVEKVVLHHMRPLLLAQEGQVSRRAIYRLFRDTGARSYQAGVAVALHALADHRATYPPDQGQAETQALLGVVHQLIATYFEQYDRVIDPSPLLTGRDLMETFGLSEGRLIGLLLNRLKEAQATKQVQDKAEALAFIKADPDFVNYQNKTSIRPDT